jgi:VWFA-related protein
MEAISRGLSSVPGRKNLVWFSDGFPFSMGYGKITMRKGRPSPSQLGFEPLLIPAMRSLTDANVAVYPIDSRGLFGVAMADSSLGGDPYSGDDQSSGTSLPQSIMEAHSSMDAMARMTGGRAFYGRNDLEGALSEALVHRPVNSFCYSACGASVCAGG